MKYFKITITLFILLCLSTSAFAIDLTKDGKALAEIVVDSKTPNIQINFAAKELQLWISKISGVTLPITSDFDKSKTQIVLGTFSSSVAVEGISKIYKGDAGKMNDNDGFAIRSEGKTVYIYGTLPKSVINGVFSLLELNSDIIFVRPLNAETGSGTIYSKVKNFKLTKTNHIEIPVFKYIRSLGPNNALWQTRLRNRFIRKDIAIIGNRKKFAHLAPVWETEKSVVRQTGIGKSHPEYFALRDGKRQKGHWSQLCFTSEGLLNYHADLIKGLYKELPEDVLSISTAHEDNHRVCECKNCIKPIKLEDGTEVKPGDPAFRSTQFFSFYNKIIKKAGIKDTQRNLRCYAYLWSGEPPRLELSENLQVMFAPYVKSHKVPITHKDNSLWGDRARKWMKQHKNMYVFEYYMCTTTPQFYNPVSDIAAQDLQFYAKSGVVRGMYQDQSKDDLTGIGDKSPDKLNNVNGYDASAMEFWVLSRLYWDPSQNVEALRIEFCRRAYRKAAKPMREYYRLIQDVWHKDPIASTWNDNPLMLTRQYIVKNNLQEPCRKLLAEAERLVEHPGSKDLVQRSRAVFEKWLLLEARLGQKVELSVPYTSNVSMENFDFDSGVWTKAAKFDDFRVRNSPDIKSSQPTIIKVLNDRDNIYFAIHATKEDPELLKQLKVKTKTNGWPQKPFIELFIDGDQQKKNGYYQLAFNALGSKWVAKGHDDKYSNNNWTVKGQINDDNWKVILKWPLASFGREITMNNRFGMMMYRNTGNQTWLGVNVHEPTGFNDLILKAD